MTEQPPAPQRGQRNARRRGDAHRPVRAGVEIDRGETAVLARDQLDLEQPDPAQLSEQRLDPVGEAVRRLDRLRKGGVPGPRRPSAGIAGDHESEESGIGRDTSEGDQVPGDVALDDALLKRPCGGVELSLVVGQHAPATVHRPAVLDHRMHRLDQHGVAEARRSLECLAGSCASQLIGGSQADGASRAAQPHAVEGRDHDLIVRQPELGAGDQALSVAGDREQRRIRAGQHRIVAALLQQLLHPPDEAVDVPARVRPESPERGCPRPQPRGGPAARERGYLESGVGQAPYGGNDRPFLSIGHQDSSRHQLQYP